MVDATTNNYNLTQPTVGGDLNIWGGILNNAVIAALDSILGSNLPLTINTTDVNISVSQFQNSVFVLTGVLTGNRNLILPLSANSLTAAVGGRFVVINSTTGAFNVTVKTIASGSVGVTVPQGGIAFLYSDTVNVGYSNSGLPASIQAVNGNPNTQLAGTAGSVNTNASFAWDYTNGILYVCTTTGTSTTAVWINAFTSSVTLPIPTPQGYLTPTSNTPIIPADSIAATTLYYTPYEGNWAAYHNGVSIVPFKFTQMSLALTTSQAASNLYDVFIAYNAGVPVIGTGPSWAASGGSITAGSCARGTGAGSTAIQRDATTGLWVNSNQINLTYNIGAGNVNLVVPAGQAIFVGSIFVDTVAGQITCHRSYGQSRKWAISNAYNRQNTFLQAGDGTATWAYSTTSSLVHPSNLNSNNNATVFNCLPEEVVENRFTQKSWIDSGSAGAAALFGIGLNVTNAFSGTVASNFLFDATSVPSTMTAAFNMPPTLGINIVYCLEEWISPGAATYFGTQANMMLEAKWRV